MADGITGGDLNVDQMVGERVAKRFIIERLIGRGQLSTTFRAHDERLHRRVAVKVFHPHHRDDVLVVETQLSAARAVARLSHEHIAMVIDRGEYHGMPVVVMEYVRGESLQERIERFAPLAVGEVVEYCLQSARALAYAHGQGVVHGNIRPVNMLLTEEREIKIVDFGGGSYVAQLVGDPYSAPELREVDADTPAEVSDDVYALGVVAAVALTEHAPREGMDPAELQNVRPDVSPQLAGTIARALATDPRERHLSMRELAAELASIREASIPTRTPTQEIVEQPTEAMRVEHITVAHADAPKKERREGRRQRRSRARTPREARARILAWSMVLAPLLALIIFGVMIAGERASDQVKSPSNASNAPLKRVKIAEVVSFDPEPDGDGSEHEDEVANAFDSDRETSWQSEGYATSDFNNGSKKGVGLVLRLDDEYDVRELQIATDLPNWTAEVRAASSPSTTLDGWRKVSKSTSVRDNERIDVTLDGKKTEYLLLWITRLALDVDDPSKVRARVLELGVFAPDA